MEKVVCGATADAEVARELSYLASCTSKLLSCRSEFCICNLNAGVPLAEQMCAVQSLISIVFGGSRPTEVVDGVIGGIPVIVSRMVGWRWGGTMERLTNETTQLEVARHPAPQSEAHERVTISVDPNAHRATNLSSAPWCRSPELPFPTYFIGRCTRDCSPLAHASISFRSALTSRSMRLSRVSAVTSSVGAQR